MVVLELGDESDDDSESNSCLFCLCEGETTRSRSGKLDGMLSWVG